MAPALDGQRADQVNYTEESAESIFYPDNSLQTELVRETNVNIVELAHKVGSKEVVVKPKQQCKVYRGEKHVHRFPNMDELPPGPDVVFVLADNTASVCLATGLHDVRDDGEEKKEKPAISNGQSGDLTLSLDNLDSVGNVMEDTLDPKQKALWAKIQSALRPSVKLRFWHTWTQSSS
jgi:hypothetical protein